jgi:hypothetical protein
MYTARGTRIGFCMGFCSPEVYAGLEARKQSS